MAAAAAAPQCPRVMRSLAAGSNPAKGAAAAAAAGPLLLFLGVALAATPALAAVEIPKLSLIGDIEMPALGLGVYLVPPGEKTYKSVKGALELGYRMVDTAQMYHNEADVGRAVVDSGIPREQLWIQSKLTTENHGYFKTLKTVRQSIKNMGLDYLDCYLIHSPIGGKLVETYDALLKLKAEGLLRTVGVSNFDVRHIKPLLLDERPLPVLNQIEMHPLIMPERQQLLKYCQAHGIRVQAYGSLFFGQDNLLNHKVVKEVVASTGKSAAQVLLRWGYQMDFQLIPKSVKGHRQEENMNIFDFELSQEQMLALDKITGSLKAYWNPVADAPVDLGETRKYMNREEL